MSGIMVLFAFPGVSGFGINFSRFAAKVSRMGIELLVVAVSVHQVPLGWRHQRRRIRQKGNCHQGAPAEDFARNLSHFPQIQAFRMQECAKTFDNKL